MSINGEAGGEPLKAGIAIADLATGLFASQAILLALHARHTTGLGQQVEVSLLESMLAMLHPHTSSYLNAGLVGKPHGNSHPMIAPYDLIPTADRPIFLPSGNDGQMRRLADGHRSARAGRRSALSHQSGPRRAPPRAARRPGRRSSASGRRLSCADACGTRPCRPARSIRSTRCTPIRRCCTARCCRRSRTLAWPAAPCAWPASRSSSPPRRPALRRHPPRLGEHTDEILAELGYSRRGRRADRSGVARRLEPHGVAVRVRHAMP